MQLAFLVPAAHGWGLASTPPDSTWRLVCAAVSATAPLRAVRHLQGRHDGPPHPTSEQLFQAERLPRVSQAAQLSSMAVARHTSGSLIHTALEKLLGR